MPRPPLTWNLLQPHILLLHTNIFYYRLLPGTGSRTLEAAPEDFFLLTTCVLWMGLADPPLPPPLDEDAPVDDQPLSLLPWMRHAAYVLHLGTGAAGWEKNGDPTRAHPFTWFLLSNQIRSCCPDPPLGGVLFPSWIIWLVLSLSRYSHSTRLLHWPGQQGESQRALYILANFFSTDHCPPSTSSNTPLFFLRIFFSRGRVELLVMI